MPTLEGSTSPDRVSAERKRLISSGHLQTEFRGDLRHVFVATPGEVNDDHFVRAHGGRIELDSRVGQGTTFKIWLPLRDRQTRLLEARLDG